MVNQYPPLPLTPDLSDPGKHGLTSYDVSHLALGTRDNTRVGAWLMLPSHSSGKVETLTSDDTVVLYCHGNGSNRYHPVTSHSFIDAFF